jgi:hypothetical protein
MQSQGKCLWDLKLKSRLQSRRFVFKLPLAFLTQRVKNESENSGKAALGSKAAKAPHWHLATPN